MVVALSRVALDYSTANGPVSALDHITGSIGEGEFVSVVGASGCGKSTLLKLIAGLLEPSSGTVLVAGQSPRTAQRAKQVGVVFQKPTLLPWRTVRSNVELLCQVGVKQDAETVRHQAEAMLKLVGLLDMADRYPVELSGGMQQRVAIARALALDPPVLLMDEPFAALDLITRDQLNGELIRIAETAGKTVLFVTHAVAEAVLLSDRIWIMSPRPGRIVADLAVGLRRPRSVAERRTPRFHELTVEVGDRLLEAAALRDAASEDELQ